MTVVDEYLGNRCPTTGPLDHFLTLRTTHGDVGFLETGVLALKQRLGPKAEAAGEFCIYFNLRHIKLFLPSVCKWAPGGRNSRNPGRYWKPAIFSIAYNPGPAENEYLFRPGLFEQPSASTARRSTRIDVIDQQDRLAGQDCFCSGARRKGRCDGSSPLLASHAPKRRGGLAAANDIMVHLDAGASRELPADQHRLVEPATP